MSNKTDLDLGKAGLLSQEITPGRNESTPEMTSPINVGENGIPEAQAALTLPQKLFKELSSPSPEDIRKKTTREGILTELLS